MVQRGSMLNVGAKLSKEGDIAAIIKGTYTALPENHAAFLLMQ
jgi:hypothetical protein